MANELQAQTTSGLTLYAVLLNSVGQAWNGAAWETITTGHWTTYDIALTEAAGGIYLGNMPSVVAGTYQFVVYSQAGASPATSDSQVDTGTVAWTGSAVADPSATGYYGSVALLREMLPQVATGAANDALLLALLKRATRIVSNHMGFVYEGVAAGDQDVWSEQAGYWLRLPEHDLGTVTAVTVVDYRHTASEAETAVAATDWHEETDGAHEGDLYRYDGWSGETWYRVTANWGYGDAPDEVVEVTLEVAVNLWRGRDRGMYSDVVGVEGGGAVGYQRALTNLQRMVLDDARRDAIGVVVT